MTFNVAGPGKTAPKLYQDFLVFDPVKGVPSILADFTPPHGEGPQLAPLIGSCKHEYVTKAAQSVPPPLDLRPDGTTIYRLAAVCKKCRVHADVRIDYSRATSPCPASNHPLHHFRRMPQYDHKEIHLIRYAWECSVEECRATLFIQYRKSRLDDEDIHLIQNPELLKKRYNNLLQDEPEREGIKLATQMDALSRLRRYIKDSLLPQHSKRQIPANNKRFQEAYGMNGADCGELLERFGFEYADGNWVLPNPEPLDDRLSADGSSERELLEDVEIELFLWMHKLASEYGMVNPHSTEILSSADREIERTLAAQGYTRYVAFRRTVSNEAIPFFSSLGVLPDFSDSLIEYAYDRQASCDPGLQAYYFECLQVIAEGRYSEQLQMKVAMLQSEDVVSRRDLSAAYRSLNISVAESKTISDERIIEKYQAHQPDLGAVAQEEARAHLYKIGVARSSQTLIRASRQSVDTYDDALNWLGNGVNRDTSDEGILAVLSIKTGESKSNEEIGLKAISTIAQARKSNHLNSFLLTGRQDGYTMSVDEALRHLNIEQKLESIDPTILPVIFDNARSDRPGETTEKAITTIQQAMAGASNGGQRHDPETWPVGLTSLGNTCYLNSLLQYYFSIKPLRDIVLNYDQYKLDISQHEGKKGRVGQRMISMIEIEGGQKFAEELKHLFERMIKSRDSAVKPEEDLVCRAFLPPKEYKLLGPIVNSEKTDKPDDPVVNGIDSAIEDKLTDADVLTSPIEATGNERQESDASSTTLHASINGEVNDVSMKDAEMPPTPPGTPGPNGEEKGPPLPRRWSTTKAEALAKAEANARLQQDVTEVHDTISFLLRCGINPRSWDGQDEQEDAFRDLFAVRMTQTVLNKGVEQEPQVLSDSAIQLNVPNEPTDLYTALDAVFDLQPHAENAAIESYKSIEALPPILQINIPRIGYDSSKGANGTFKSTECVTLKDDLYLDRYFDMSHQHTLPLRRQCWGWRRELQALKREQKLLSKTTITDLDGPTAVAQTAEYLTTLDEVNADLDSVGVEPIEGDGDITTALRDDAKQQADRLASLDTEIHGLQKHLDDQFKDMKGIKYRLAAVFIHRGNHGHGHYWVYIHDFENDVWRSYNDETVEKVTKLESIFEAKTWDQGTPAYAAYVAEDKLDYVQAVCRDLEPVLDPPPATESGQIDASSKQESVSFVDPKKVMEGGEHSWDPPREVAAVVAGNMGGKLSRPRLIIHGPGARDSVMEEISGARIEEIQNSMDSDAKLALDLQEQECNRGHSPPKRQHDHRRGSNEGGSPSKKPRRVAGWDDLTKISNLDLNGARGKDEQEPEA